MQDLHLSNNTGKCFLVNGWSNAKVNAFWYRIMMHFGCLWCNNKIERFIGAITSICAKWLSIFLECFLKILIRYFSSFFSHKLFPYGRWFVLITSFKFSTAPLFIILNTCLCEYWIILVLLDFKWETSKVGNIFR